MGFARWGGSRAPTPSPAPTSGAGCRNTYCRSVLSLRAPCPHLWGRGLGVGAREPHRSLPASGPSSGFLDPMGASDFDPAAVRAQTRFPRPALVRRFPGLCFSRVTSVPRIPAYRVVHGRRPACRSPIVLRLLPPVPSIVAAHRIDTPPRPGACSSRTKRLKCGCFRLPRETAPGATHRRHPLIFP